LIKSLVAGDSAFEGELADLVIEDLDRLSSQRDMDFVNEVFIPLIKAEKTVPVTIDAAKSMLDSQDDEAKQLEKQKEEKSTFGTNILKEEQMDVFKKAIKGFAKKDLDILSPFKWNKTCEWISKDITEDSPKKNLWNMLKGKGPCIILTECSNESEEKFILGSYLQGTVPSSSQSQSEPKQG
jgi:hypothetical protein